MSLELDKWSWYSSEWYLSMPGELMAGFGDGEPWELPSLADETAAIEPSTMSDTRKVPEDEWQVYKEEIRAMYLSENKSREEVMAAMEKTYGFRARFVGHRPLISKAAQLR
jgi:hypothetical protein